MKPTLLVALAAWLAVVAAAVASPGERVDQTNDIAAPEYATSHGCGAAVARLSQGFTPSRRLLSAVQIVLRPGGSFPADGMATELHVFRGTPGGAELGAARAAVPPVAAGQVARVRFDFEPPLVLDPEGVYVLSWTTPGDRYLSWIGSDDRYAGGTTFACADNPNPSVDYAFATITPADAAAPQAAIAGGGPAEGAYSNDRNPVLQLGGSDDLSYPSRLGYNCSLNGEPVACAATTRLVLRGDGPQRFEARATDEAGRTSEAPTVRTWTLDTTSPSAPRTRFAGRVVRVTSTDPDGPGDTPRLRCGVDRRSLSPCAGAIRLSRGRHALRLQAIDRAGNTSRVVLVAVVVR